MKKVSVVLLVALAAVVMAVVACGSDTKPKDEQASDLLNRGLQAHVDGKLDEAAADYREVLNQDPQNKYAYYNLGVIDQATQRASSAENNYRLALGIDPDYEPALYNLAILRAQVGATLEAIDLYRHVLTVNDENANAHYNLGLLLRGAGDVAPGDAEVARARS